MEIKFNNFNYKNKFTDINETLIDNHIIGITGDNYDLLLYLIYTSKSKKITFNNLYLGNKNNNYIGYIPKVFKFYTNNVRDEILLYLNRANVKVNNYDKRINKALKYFNLDESILNKKISELSSCIQKVLSLVLITIYNPNIIIIDDLFRNLDYNYKKVVINVLREFRKKFSKTIIIGSDNTNDLYLYTERMLILGNKNIYGKTKDLFVNLDYSNYNIKKPDIVNFVDLAKKEGHNIEYSQDIRDLIKDVYKDVTK